MQVLERWASHTLEPLFRPGVAPLFPFGQGLGSLISALTTKKGTLLIPEVTLGSIVSSDLNPQPDPPLSKPQELMGYNVELSEGSNGRTQAPIPSRLLRFHVDSETPF